MLYLVKIFSEETDDQHKLTLKEIIDKLDTYDVTADRKTLYLDFEELRHFGFDIIGEQDGRQFYYYLGTREFELAELKLLVDSVQAAKFITDKKSSALIKKLEHLVSNYEAKQLQRQVVIAGRIKTDNKMVYNNVDTIYTAISSNKKISFHYFQWDVRKKRILRRNGALYKVSPWCLMWDDEYYYLVAFDSKEEKIKHYRVDKMLHLEITADAREGQSAFKKFNMAHYAKSLFGMYGGEETTVSLECDNDKAAILIDRFGKDIMFFPKDDNRFTAHINVVPSRQFLGWIMALGDGIKIIGPDSVIEEMKQEIKRLQTLYMEEDQ